MRPVPILLRASKAAKLAWTCSRRYQAMLDKPFDRAKAQSYHYACESLMFYMLDHGKNLAEELEDMASKMPEETGS